MKSLLRKLHTSRTINPAIKITQDSSSATSNLTTAPLTIVELFQSQSCSSCPPTNANLVSLSSPNTLLLAYHVTYWDHLGWVDTFGNRAFDARQRDYVQRLNLRSAFTPQVVVNGQASGVGNTAEALRDVIRDGSIARNRMVDVNVETDLNDHEIVIIRVSSVENAAGGEHKLKVRIVRYDGEMRDVHIKSGENMGRVLPHLNVVRSLEDLGEVSVGKDFVCTTRQDYSGLKAVVLVQHGIGGPIVGAKML